MCKLDIQLPADTEEVDRFLLENPDYNAQDLLKNSVNSKLIKDFYRANRLLFSTLEEIRKVFPDAQYYSGAGNFFLLLGLSHGNNSGGEDPRQERVALEGETRIDGGDW